MPGSTDACTLCHRAFFGKQKFLRCVDCQLRFHDSCLNLPDVDLSVYRSTGSFKCSSCLKNKSLINDSTPVRSSLNPRCNDNLNDNETELSVVDVAPDFSDAAVVSPSALHISIEPLFDILNSLQEELRSVKSEVSALRSENRELKSSLVEMSNNFKLIVSQVKSDSTSSTTVRRKTSKVKNSSGAVDNNLADGTSKPNNNIYRSSSSGSHSNIYDSNHISSDKTETNSSSVTIADVTKDYAMKPGFIPSDTTWADVTRRGKTTNRKPSKSTGSASGVGRPATRKIVIGRSNNHSSLVKPALPQVRKRALFVSRLAPSVSPADIKDLLKDFNLEHLVCNKLKTKYSSYNSFHVEVLSSDFEKLFNSDVWPSGIFVSPFYGKFIVSGNNSSDNKPLEDGVPVASSDVQ